MSDLFTAKQASSSCSLTESLASPSRLAWLATFIAKLEQRDDIRYMGDDVKEAEWGQRSIRFYDLDGHIIEVGENLKMVVKRFLNLGMTMEQVSKRMDVSIPDLERLLNS